MATIVTVHGTFAHEGAATAPVGSRGTAEPQWWQSGSSFEQDMRDLVDASPAEGGAKLEVTRFEWSGENSETARREAGKRLLAELKHLEARNEPYCVVGHSHGGSVMSWALLESASRRQRLDGLKRWITVGTPFVALKKERLLFQRLDLMRKVIFVASFMLVAMFLVYIAAELLSGGRMLFGSVFPAVLVVTGAMMSLPIIVFYFVLKYWDGRTLLHYRRSVRQRASDSFGKRWLSVTHPDDEAVQGLAFLPGAKLYFFDKSFAVPAITMLSVLAVPLIYLVVLTSPTIMVALGDWLKSNVYDTQPHAAAEQAIRASRQQFQEMRTRAQTRPLSEAERRAVWESYRDVRRKLEAQYPDYRQAERGLRFKQRFFEENGRPCAGGQLCGGGRDIRINSGLLLHLVTDELSSAIGGEGADDWSRSWLVRLVLPAVVVPVIFGLLALALMLLIRVVAKLISDGASRTLNTITNAEVKRAAFGNDTEGEIAVGAVDRPGWLERSPPRLPPALADVVTDYSNTVASRSLAKFRRAIGQLASAEPKHTADSAIMTYFTWKELVHASYFDVPEVRKLIAQAITRADGFSPSQRFQADPDFHRTAHWLGEIEGADPHSASPTGLPQPQPRPTVTPVPVVPVASLAAAPGSGRGQSEKAPG